MSFDKIDFLLHSCARFYKGRAICKIPHLSSREGEEPYGWISGYAGMTKHVVLRILRSFGFKDVSNA